MRLATCFNRSYYEEILVTRVHPEILEQRPISVSVIDNNIWKRRFEEINNFEKHLVNNGTIILKFFLNVSKEEQKERFLEKINRPEKNWKFSVNDAKERSFWDDYMTVYEDMFNHTSTKYAPWLVHYPRRSQMVYSSGCGGYHLHAVKGTESQVSKGQRRTISRTFKCEGNSGEPEIRMKIV